MLTCPTCDRPLQRRPVSRGPREVGTVSALIENHPELACPEGHVVPQPGPEVARVLTSAVSAQLVTARRTRFRKALRCGSCDAELTIPGRRTDRSVSELVPTLGVVRLVLDVPMLRCPECGTQQLPEEVRGDVDAAVAALTTADDPGTAG